MACTRRKSRRWTLLPKTAFKRDETPSGITKRKNGGNKTGFLTAFRFYNFLADAFTQVLASSLIYAISTEGP